jgi:hypothetical protein
VVALGIGVTVISLLLRVVTPTVEAVQDNFGPLFSRLTVCDSGELVRSSADLVAQGEDDLEYAEQDHRRDDGEDLAVA